MATEAAEKVDTIESRLQDYNRNGLIVVSPSMQAVYKQIEQAAGVIANVLILGESGTGKDSVAQAIHSLSSRRSKDMVYVDLAAIPRELIEDELFGHIRGAYTNASHNRQGKFEYANGSTIFLNEIGEIDTKLQAKLLAVIERKTVTMLGENTPRSIDVRVIAATNKDVYQGMREGTFRNDLYYRLAVLEIHLPPLAERREDIHYLIAHFMQRFQQFHDRKVSPFQSHEYGIYQNEYDWPGNVRELSNAVEKVVVTGENKIGILQKMKEQALADKSTNRINTDISGVRPLADIERDLILELWKKTGNNTDEVAKQLGISRRTVFRKLAAYGVLRSDGTHYSMGR